MTSPFLTVEEAAAYLRCKRTKIFELLSEGKIQRGLKLGKRTVILAESLAEFVAEGSYTEAPKKKAPRRSRRKAPKVEAPEVGYGDGIRALLNQAALVSSPNAGSEG